MTNVGPMTLHVGGQASGQASGQAGGQASGQAVTIMLDAQKLTELLDYCHVARTRSEIQAFCDISSRDYFMDNILRPLLDTGRLLMTIPEKPTSPNQKYIKAF